MGLFKWNKQRSKSVDCGVMPSGSLGNLQIENMSAPASSSRRSMDVPMYAIQEPANEYLSPELSHDNESIALSETDTLLHDRRQGSELQETFEDNFTHYYPFLLRRMRLAALRAAEISANAARTNQEIENKDGEINLNGSANNNEASINESEFAEKVEDDDASTIYNDSIDSNLTRVLRKPVTCFNLKREFVIVSEFMKNSQYIFPSRESFELFKDLRKSTKKSPYIFVYDSENKIRKLKQDELRDYPGCTIDNRQHLVPLDSKIRGLGLPLFKVQVPYLSSFKKNAPFIIFKRYREQPARPVNEPATTKEEDFETYNFCTVYTKHFQKVKRITFYFEVEGGESFKILMFMNNFKPYADFTYNSTRFRVLGTPIITTLGLTYNPSLKLLLVDSGKPSLCDDVVNKKANFDLSKMIKKKFNSDEVNADVEDPKETIYVEDDSSTHINPYPNPKNPLLDDDNFYVHHSVKKKVEYVSDNFPPFGSFQDSMMYERTSNILPKKFSELGKIEIYQDLNENIGNTKSTLSFDLDTLVLNCIMATLREIAIKSAGKAVNGGGNNRLNATRSLIGIGGMNSAIIFM